MSGSGTRPTQPRDYNWGASRTKEWRLRSRKPRLSAVGIIFADYATPLYPQKSALLRRPRRSRTKSLGVRLYAVHKQSSSSTCSYILCQYHMSLAVDWKAKPGRDTWHYTNYTNWETLKSSCPAKTTSYEAVFSILLPFHPSSVKYSVQPPALKYIHYIFLFYVREQTSQNKQK
jgi:hypothetical protein